MERFKQNQRISMPLIYLCICLVSLSCAKHESLIPIETAEIVKFSVQGDSLEVFSTKESLFFPFGKFSGPPKGIAFEYKRVKIYGDSLNTDTALFLYSKDFNALLYHEEDGHYHVVSCKIFGKGITILDGITIGMSSPEFLEKWFYPNSDANFKRFVLLTGLDGLKYRFEFVKGALKNISIESDYKIEPY